MGFFEIKLRIGLLASALFLTGCGGGGDDSGSTTPKPVDPVNQGPIVTLTAVDEQIEQETFTLKATANDTDGEISSYSWSHDASFDFISDGLSSAEVSFTSPDISEDITVNFTVTVTDNDGASASSSQAVLIKRKVSNVTITGLVTDEPIASAELEIVVGGESFQVQANDSGRYTAVLNIDESSTKKLVRVKAKGLDALNPGVEFVSQLSSVEKLLAQAGEDNTLDSNDNFGVNITNVTTAEFALLTRDGTEPASEEELNSALLNVDADEKIQLATLIKIVVDNPDYQLPEGINSTLELVANEQVAKQFEEEVIEKDPEIIEKTKKEIKEDDALVTGATGTLEGNYIINSPRYHTNTAFHLSLRADGSGQFSSNTSSAISWAENAGVYTLDFAEKVTIYQNSDAESSESVVLTGFSFTVLAENDVFRTIEVTRSTERTVVNSNSGSVTMTTEDDETYTTNLIYKNKTISLLAEQLVGEWALHVQDNDFYTSYDPNLPETLQFYADGTGVVDSSEAFTWQLNSHSLIVNYDDGGETGQLELWFTKALSGGYQLVGLDTSFDKPSDTLTGLLIKKQAVSTTNDDLIGRWHGFIGTSQSYDLNIFSDGTMMIGLGITDWQGHLNDGQFTRKRFIYNNEIVTSCEGFDASCYLESEMIHEFISIVGNLYYIKRTLNYYLPNGEIRSQSGAILVYEYSKDLTYSAFTEELLENYTEFYSADGQTDRIYTEYDENGNVIYVVELEGQTYTGATFNDGVLSYDQNGETWHLELVSSDTSSIVVCHYQDGGTCNATSQITYLPKRPKVTLSANSSGNGEISPASQASFLYQNVGFKIVPDDGYVLDTIEGCEGYVDGNYYIAKAGSDNCEIIAKFKSRTSLAEQAKIKDPELAKCFNNLGVGVTLDSVKEFVCFPSTEIRSLDGLTSLENLEKLYLNNLNVGSHVELSEFEKLEILALNGGGEIESVKVFKPENILILKLTEQNVSSLELSSFTGLKELNLSSNPLKEIEISTLHDLNDLDLAWTDISSLDISDKLSLKALNIAGVKLNNVDLTGLFELENLDISFSKITDVDFSDLTKLNKLDISWTNVINLDFSNLSSLKMFVASGVDYNKIDWSELYGIESLIYSFYPLSDFDIAPFENLNYLVLQFNGLSSVNIPEDNKITYLELSQNNLKAIDANMLKDVEYLSVAYNDLEKINISNSNELHILNLSGNPITSIDFSKNEELTVVWARKTLLSVIEGIENINDKEAFLDFTHNVFSDNIMNYFYELIDENLYSNIHLSDHYFEITVNHSENGSVDKSKIITFEGEVERITITPNEGYKVSGISGCNTSLDDMVDNTLTVGPISESCGIEIEFVKIIPLATLAGITDPNLAKCVNKGMFEELYEVDKLNCIWHEYSPIYSLEGLASFPNLETVNLGRLSLGGTIDFSFIPTLKNIHLRGSSIQSLIVADPSMIESLALDFSDLSFFDTSSFINLKELNLASNRLLSIDLSQNLKLETLILNSNPITRLDVSNLSNLKDLRLQNVLLEFLDLTQNINLEYLDISETYDLAGMDFSALPNLKTLNISQLNPRLINNQQFPTVEKLYFTYSGLRSFNTEGLNNLTHLYLKGNPISDINKILVSKPEQLITFDISDTIITELDISQFVNLKILELEESSVSHLDVSGNQNIEVIKADNSWISSIEGLESINNKYAFLSFNWTPLSYEAINYLTKIRDDGYVNIEYSISYPVIINTIGSGGVDVNRLLLKDNEIVKINLYPIVGHEIGRITGCDGMLYEQDSLPSYYEVGPIVEGCDIEVEFIETTN